MSDELERVKAFVARIDMAGTRTEAFSWGTAVFMPECPLRHDSNYLLVQDLPERIDAAELSAQADRIQGGAGITHRTLMFWDVARADALAPGLESLGWKSSRGIAMVHRAEVQSAAQLARVQETTAAALYEARQTQILSYAWGHAELARQLLAARAELPGDPRRFAVFEQGEPVSWAELYLDQGVAQIEEVATLERARNRGYAKAVVTHLVHEARHAGADLIFLVADADDWPLTLYERLGFGELARYRKFAIAAPRPA